jgi:putative copper resistance protein D
MNVDMATMDPPPLTWASFLSSWQLAPGWLTGVLLAAAAYVALRLIARGHSTVRPWRTGCFLFGCTLLWVCAASGVGAYAMSLFWMHMVLHLLLIMVVPAALVIGHPLTVVVEGLGGEARAGAQRALGTRSVGVLTHPLTGLLLYSVVIVGTHLTGFMDEMAKHGWLMTGEQLLYVVAGTCFLLPLLADEPIRRNAPYGARLLVLLLAMVPDTVVGIVLLQSDDDLFPALMRNRPGWAPPPVRDVNIAGGLMWAGGDGLMMLIAIGLMLSVISSPSRRERLTGSWLEDIRRQVVTENGERVHPDSQEALEAYNRRLQRLTGHPQD